MSADAIQSMDRDTFEVLWKILPPVARHEVAKIRGRTDVMLFCDTFFPERFRYAWSPMHRAILARPKVPWHERATNVFRALAAPRGNAKSTLVSFADLIHDVCYGIERFVGVLSTTADLATDILIDLHGVFTEPESYEVLHEVFGPFTVKGGTTNFVVKCPNGDPLGTRFIAKSLQGTTRGPKHRGTRFTRFVLDDLEHPKHVLEPIQRAYAQAFIEGDVCKAGEIGGGLIVDLVGTVLHADSVLARLLKSPAWKGKKYQSVIRWPTNKALWEECKLIWSNLANETRVEDSLAFYHAHKAEMDAGAEVLWPEGESIYALHIMLWSGASAFFRDKQNEPFDPETQIFYPENFARCIWEPHQERLTTVSGKVWKLRDLDIGIWHDRAKGGAKGDYPATVAIARDPLNCRHVLEVLLKKEPASGQQARVWSMWDRMRGAKRVQVGCDDTAQTETFSDAFERQREQRRKDGKAWNINVQSFILSEDKQARMARLEPDCANGWLQFERNLPAEVDDEFRGHPHPAHDDAHDAIERADWLVCGGGMGVLQSAYVSNR